MTGVSKTAISEYLGRFRRAGISHEESLELTDTELLELFEQNEQCSQLTALFPEYAKRFRRRGMTKQLPWQEYGQKHPDGYRYSQFRHHFGIFLESGEVTMRQTHEPGGMTYLDYARERSTTPMGYVSTSRSAGRHCWTIERLTPGNLLRN